MNLTDVFNPNPPLRTAAQWKALLESAVLELEDAIGVHGRITAFTVQDDKPGFTTHTNEVDVVFDTQAPLGFELCGTVKCRVLIGKSVKLAGTFLAFSQGIRVPSHNHEGLAYVFDPASADRNKWTCSGWIADEKSDRDNSRWRKK